MIGVTVIDLLTLLMGGVDGFYGLSVLVMAMTEIEEEDHPGVAKFHFSDKWVKR